MWEYEISRASSFGTAQKDRGSFQGVFKALNRCSIIVSTTFILQEPLVAYRFPFHFCKHHCTLSGFNIEQKEPPVVRYTPTTGGFVMFLPKEVCARQWIQGEVLNLRMVADARQESTDNFGAEKHPRKTDAPAMNARGLLGRWLSATAPRTAMNDCAFRRSPRFALSRGRRTPALRIAR